MSTLQRYMTQDEKSVLLARWQQTKLEQPWTKPEQGGLGYPDKAIFQLCDRLNAMPGLCTLQSCSGHWSPQDGTPRTAWPGQLWLWPDPTIAGSFYYRMFELAERYPLIERVNIIAHDDGREVIALVFKGEAHEKLRESSELIVDFFKKLHSR